MCVVFTDKRAELGDNCADWNIKNNDVIMYRVQNNRISVIPYR